MDAGLLTVTVQVAINPPSSVVAMITQIPSPTAITTPLETIHTDSLELDHLTFLFEESSGITDAFNSKLSPTPFS